MIGSTPQVPDIVETTKSNIPTATEASFERERERDLTDIKGKRKGVELERLGELDQDSVVVGYEYTLQPLLLWKSPLRSFTTLLSTLITLHILTSYPPIYLLSTVTTIITATSFCLVLFFQFLESFLGIKNVFKGIRTLDSDSQDNVRGTALSSPSPAQKSYTSKLLFNAKSDLLWIQPSIITTLNTAILQLFSVLLVTNPPKTLLVILLSTTTMFISKYFSTRVLLFTAVCACFSLPKVYQVYRREIDEGLKKLGLLIQDSVERTTSYGLGAWNRVIDASSTRGKTTGKGGIGAGSGRLGNTESSGVGMGTAGRAEALKKRA